MNSKKFLSYLQRYAAHLDRRRQGRENVKETKTVNRAAKPNPAKKQGPTEIQLEQ